VRTGTLAESGLVTAMGAGTAGAIAAVTATPVDVVKTRVMLAAAENAASEASASKPEKSGLNGLVDAFGKTVKSRKEGVASAAAALDPLASSEKKGGRARSRSGVRSLLKRALRDCGGAAH
jgi:solute carrier family 25 S-adenosylmethionine transporter 26